MHRYRMAALVLSLILSFATISHAQQEQIQITLDITNGDIGSLISIAVNAGKVADVTVGSDGNAMSLLNLSNLGKVRVEIYHEICQNGQTIRVVAEGTTVPEDENCTRRRIGGFLLGDGMRISIDWANMTATISGGGLSTPIKIGIGVAAAGGATAVIIVVTGDDGETVVPSPAGSPPVTSPPVTSPPVTPPVTPTFNGLNRIFEGSGTLGAENCSFFSPTANIRITIANVDVNGQNGTLIKVHLGPGVTFNHTVTATQTDTVFNAMSNTINIDIGGQTWQTNFDNLQVSKATNVLTGTQVLSRIGGGSVCTARYVLILPATS